MVTKIRLEGGHHMARLAELCCPTSLSRRAYDACSYLIQQGQQLCSEAGAELVVMTIPDAWQLTPRRGAPGSCPGRDAGTVQCGLPRPAA